MPLFHTGERAPLYEEEKQLNVRALATKSFTADVNARLKDHLYGMRPEEILEEGRQRALDLRYAVTKAVTRPRMGDNRMQAEIAKGWRPADETEAEHEQAEEAESSDTGKQQQPEAQQQQQAGPPQGARRNPSRRASVLLPLAEKAPFIAGMLQQRRILPKADDEWSPEQAPAADASDASTSLLDALTVGSRLQSMVETLGRGKSRRSSTTHSAPLPHVDMLAMAASIRALPRHATSGDQVLISPPQEVSGQSTSFPNLGSATPRSTRVSVELRASLQALSSDGGGRHCSSNGGGSTTPRSGRGSTDRLSLDCVMGEGEDEEAGAGRSPLTTPRLPSLPSGIPQATAAARARRFSSIDPGTYQQRLSVGGSGPATEAESSYASWLAAAASSLSVVQGSSSGGSGGGGGVTGADSAPVTTPAQQRPAPLHRLATPPLGYLCRKLTGGGGGGAGGGGATTAAAGAGDANLASPPSHSPPLSRRTLSSEAFSQAALSGVSSAASTAPWVQTLAVGGASRHGPPPIVPPLQLQLLSPAPPAPMAPRHQNSSDLSRSGPPRHQSSSDLSRTGAMQAQALGSPRQQRAQHVGGR